MVKLGRNKRQFGVLAASAALVMGLVAPLHAAEWKILAPKGSEFSASLPGAPKLDKKVEKEKTGTTTTNYDWSLEAENAYYLVGYQEHPAAAARLVKADAILDETIKGFTGGNNKGQINTVKKLKLNGFAGREIKATMPDGVQLQAKLFWVKRRLYMAMAGFPTADATAAKDATKFLNSFKLLGKP